jgi:hypothetical protein
MVYYKLSALLNIFHESMSSICYKIIMALEVNVYNNGQYLLCLLKRLGTKIMK